MTGTLPATEHAVTESDLDGCQARLFDELTQLGPLVVAFSGGVDSALLAFCARRVLGRRKLLAVTADSGSLATGELERCARFAQRWDIDWRTVATDEFDNPRYVENSGDRCYWCKSALLDQLAPLAVDQGGTVALGVNLDDLDDHRPGQQAARERGAVFPLVTAGATKNHVRAMAKRFRLEVWDRPAMPCLSSRLPYGTPVEVGLLSRIDRAETALRTLGFSDVRVRHYNQIARIEVPTHQLTHAAAKADEITSALRLLGYRYVTLDLAGLRSGNLNHGLDD